MLRRLIDSFATPGLLIGLGVVMAGFYGADQFLANLERRETSADAHRLAQDGDSLRKRGKRKEAIESFNRAHLIERDNRNYTLQLADALIEDRQPERAIAVLQEVLDEDSNDGRANLLMARAATEQSHFVSTESYYHRAIFGSWGAGDGNPSVQARVELVRWLAQHGDRQSLLAELIPLEQRAKSDSAIAHQIPSLYLQAGSISQAEEAYRALIHTNNGDADAYAGLARVELQRGNYYSAQQNFLEALAHKPGDAELNRGELLARSAHNLDPTSRHLTSAEMLSRTNQVLTMALEVVQSCAVDSNLLQAAQSAITQETPRVPTNEVAEAHLDLAEKIWRSRPADCHAKPREAELLGLIMSERLSSDSKAGDSHQRICAAVVEDPLTVIVHEPFSKCGSGSILAGFSKGIWGLKKGEERRAISWWDRWRRREPDPRSNCRQAIPYRRGQACSSRCR